MDDRIVAVIASVFGAFVGLAGLGFGVVRSLIAPLVADISNVAKSLTESEARWRAELEKSERGLKELTTRAETLIRQTVEDVDSKLRREAQLIEDKTRIQLTDLQRQVEQLRTELRNGKPKASGL